MELHNKGNSVAIKVIMPSGRAERLTLPNGEFNLPNSYVLALQAHLQGPAIIKRMKPKKKKPKTHDSEIEADDKQAG